MAKKKPDDFVNTITGRIIQYKYCLGYCNSRLHRGYLTARNTRLHRCIEKQCSLFTPIETSLFWIRKKKQDDEKARNKMIQKEHKETEKEILEAVPKELEAVFCKYLYSNIYIVIVNKEFNAGPYEYFEDRRESIYFKYVPKDLCNNLDVTFHTFLPPEMRKKYMDYKNGHKRRK